MNMSTVAPSNQESLPRPYWPRGLELLIATLAVQLTFALRLPYEFVLLIIAMGAFALAVLRVDAFFYAVVFFLPLSLRHPEVFGGHDDATAILRVMMFLGLCARSFLEGRSLRSWLLGTPLSYLAIGYGLISLLSAVLFNQRTLLGMGAFIWLLSYICFYFTITGWVRTERQMRTVISLLLLSTVVVALYGLYQSAIGDYGNLFDWLYPNRAKDVTYWTGRIPSFLNYCTSLAAYLNLVLPFALACTVIRASRSLRLLAISCLVTATIALLLTQTRGAVLAFAGTLLLGVFLLSRNPKSRKVLAVTVLITVLVSAFLVTQLSTRYSTILDDSGLGRLAFWDAAWAMFLSSPLMGVGYGNFGGLFELPGEDIRRDVHNIYLQLLAETGVMGFAIFFLLVAVALHAAWRQFHRPRHVMDQVLGFAALGAILSVLSHGFVDYFFNSSPQFGALFWMTLGLLVANEHLSSESTVRCGVYLVGCKRSN
jgi:O-antigen ligase